MQMLDIAKDQQL